MPRQPRRRTLSVFLLRPAVQTTEDAFRDLGGLARHDLRAAIDADGELIVGPPRRKAPPWASFLAPHVTRAGDLDRLFNSSTSAVLLIEAEGRLFAFTFGQGRHLLERDTYEHDFGLRVVLNSVEPDRIKSVDASTIEEHTMHTRRDASQESAFGDFGLDVSRDLVRAVAGQPRDETLAHRLAGADRLAISTRAQVPELPELCGRLLKAYRSRKYKENFAWLDQLRKVKDRALVSALDGALVADIRGRELDFIHLAPPEALDPLRLGGFTYSTRDDEELDADPRISRYLDSLDDPTQVTLDRLKADKVLAFEDEQEGLIDRWSVYRCLVYEIRRDDSLFVLSSGDWYQVSDDFSQQTIDYVDALPDLGVQLPDAADGVDEQTYNEGAAQAVGALCMDRKLVPLGGPDRIELCDLITQNRQLIHVKLRGASSTLSHLFAQGIVSAELLLGDRQFRQRARGVIDGLDGSFSGLIPDDRPEPRGWEVAYAVITRGHRRQTPLTLPFFSLVSLQAAAKRLQTLGFTVSKAQIDES